MDSFKFRKQEKLKSRKVIQQLFRNRQSFSVFPLRVIWTEINPPFNEYPVQFAVSVSKRSFPKAVKRNRIKRIIREAYRLNKSILYQQLEEKNCQYGMMFLYIGKKEPTFAEIEKAVKKAIKLIPKKLDVES